MPELLAIAVAALGGSERSGQLQMATAVAAAFETGEHLVVQAGTGTGKSLAYLVPAVVPRDQRRRAGRGVDGNHRLAASTRRSRPAPTGRFTCRCAAPPAAVCAVKGSTELPVPEQDSPVVPRVVKTSPAPRRNDRKKNSSNPMAASALGRDVQRLTAWASTTDTGDRDDLKPGVADRSWSQVSVSARECIGVARCPFGSECFSERARGRAGAADIVVTNHALLAIDAVSESAVLPEHALLVVDEAHELADRVTSVATAELTSANPLGVALRRITRLVSPGADRPVGSGVGHPDLRDPRCDAGPHRSPRRGDGDLSDGAAGRGHRGTIGDQHHQRREGGVGARRSGRGTERDS